MFTQKSTKMANTPQDTNKPNPTEFPPSLSKGTRRVTPSIIGADVKIDGNLSCEGELQIDGRVKGDVNCHMLIIGLQGAITGGVTADDAKVHGALNGNLTARSIFLGSTAKVSGDVTHETLAVEPGAFLEGHCRHMSSVSGNKQQQQSPVKTEGMQAQAADLSKK